MNVLYHWVPAFVGLTILMAWGIALDISITREERRKKKAASAPAGLVERGSARP